MQLFITITALASTATALGINCRGSGSCPVAAGNLKSIQYLVNGVDDNKRYYSGQQVCANTANFLNIILSRITNPSLAMSPFFNSKHQILGYL